MHIVDDTPSTGENKRVADRCVATPRGRTDGHRIGRREGNVRMSCTGCELERQLDVHLTLSHLFCRQRDDKGLTDNRVFGVHRHNM
jgi:hypothetical protein